MFPLCFSLRWLLLLPEILSSVRFCIVAQLCLLLYCLFPVVLFQEEFTGQTQTMLKERLNTYRQHIRQPELQQRDAEGHIRTCGDGNVKIMPFFALREETKILRESYETYFIEKFKPALNTRHK